MNAPRHRSTHHNSNRSVGRWSTTVAALLAVTLLGCATEEEAAKASGPFEELHDQGLDRYIGVDEAVQASKEASVTTWTWPVKPDGASPGCLHGDPYRMATRVSDDPTGKDNLVVFLQGGGACWSDFCLAFDKAPAGVPALDLFDTTNAKNPVATWNLAYLPYCDASFFLGDARHDDDNDGTLDRDHRGLRNLSAALTVIKKQFPSPKRILLAGSSGGGYGLIMGMPLARMVWPNADILVMNDSGVGVAKPGDQWFVSQLLKEFGADVFIPKSCQDCTTNGHLTQVIAWTLRKDPTIRMAAFSTTRDFVIGSLFMQLESEVFEAALRSETKTLQDEFPGRYAAFLSDGQSHTVLLGDIAGFMAKDDEEEAEPPPGDKKPAGLDLSALAAFLGEWDVVNVDGVTFLDWFGAFINDTPAWSPLAVKPAS